VAAYLVPEIFTPFQSAIVPFLAVIMFGMGLTLTIDDFKRVATRPAAIGLGLLLQFTVMPIAAIAIGYSLSLFPELFVGLVLVGSAPGGTASNVICFLAKADVALSVSLTLASTLLAVVATPGLTWLLAGQFVPVAFGSMLLSMIEIVLAPVLIGLLLNTYLHRQLASVKPILPAVAAIVIALVIAIVVARSKPQLASATLVVLVAVVLHNLVGFLAGYWIPRWLGFDRLTCRTLSIEVGMQNSGLGVAVAQKFFSPLAALPSAVFSIWHNIAGAMLAGHWSSRQDDVEEVPAATD
jgi:BASS family bile acid:Na+ symporter